MNDLSPSQLACADQHHASIPANVTAAVDRMRTMLDASEDSDPVFVCNLSAAMANMCDESTEMREQIVFSFVAVMYHLARGWRSMKRVMSDGVLVFPCPKCDKTIEVGLHVVEVAADPSRKSGITGTTYGHHVEFIAEAPHLHASFWGHMVRCHGPNPHPYGDGAA